MPRVANLEQGQQHWEGSAKGNCNSSILPQRRNDDAFEGKQGVQIVERITAWAKYRGLDARQACMHRELCTHRFSNLCTMYPKEHGASKSYVRACTS